VSEKKMREMTGQTVPSESNHTTAIRYLFNSVLLGKSMPAQDVTDAWRGWSANHDHVGEIFAEFIDNALSMKLANNALPDEIKISWDYNANDNYATVTIEDQLGGMPDPVSAWTVGNRGNQVGPLNEHGYGFKHSIAAANPSNDGWWFWTRTQQDIDQNEFHYYAAPYDWLTDPQVVDRNNLGGIEDWPGAAAAGTVFRFRCDLAKFKGLKTALGIGGNRPDEPATYSLNLEAYLGFLYGSAIQNNDISILIHPNIPSAGENGMRAWYRVRSAIYPANYEIFQQPQGGGWAQITGQGHHAFDGVHPIAYEYEAIQVNPPPGVDWRKPFYQRNAKNRGLEIRLNGRVLAYGMFNSAIFSAVSHPSFNAFVFRINLLANQQNKEFIPKTKTTKSGMQITDELLELFACVQNHCPNMALFQTAVETTSEEEMKDYLQPVLEAAATPGNNIVVQREYNVWDSCSLDIHSVHQGSNEIYAYECKKGRARALDLYQLIMYCDGLHEQGHAANYGILVANQYAPDIPTIIQTMAANGYHTPLQITSWETLTTLQNEPYGNFNPLVE